MRLRMLVGLSGAICLAPGDEHDFDLDEAKRLIQAGFAVPVAGVAIETAVKKPPAERRKKGNRDALA